MYLLELTKVGPRPCLSGRAFLFSEDDKNVHYFNADFIEISFINTDAGAFCLMVIVLGNELNEPKLKFRQK